jgi:hypothetical protein
MDVVAACHHHLHLEGENALPFAEAYSNCGDAAESNYLVILWGSALWPADKHDRIWGKVLRPLSLPVTLVSVTTAATASTHRLASTLLFA